MSTLLARLPVSIVCAGVLTVLTALDGWSATKNHGRGCDLEITFTAPKSTSLKAGKNVTLKTKIRNVGQKRCAARSIQLWRHEGTTTNSASFSNSNFVESLPAMDPGAQNKRSFTVNNAPLGTFTFQIRGGWSDINIRNHQPVKTIQFAGTCDQIMTIGQQSLQRTAGEPINISAVITNVGTGACGIRTVGLYRYSGEKTTGKGRRIGSGKKVPKMVPQAQKTLTWTDNKPPIGTYTYQPKGSWKDGDNSNNQPKGKKVTFQKVVTCDLAITFTAPNAKSLPAGKTVNFKVKASSIGRGVCLTRPIQLWRFAGRSTSGNSSSESGLIKKIPTLASGKSRILTFKVHNPPSGHYTYEIRGNWSDTNIRNNSPVKTLKYE